VVKPLYLNKRTPVPIGYEAGWNPEPNWLFWRRQKSLAPGRILVNNSDIIVVLHYVGRAAKQSVFHSDRS
jgi:hypothetical protein